jgi:hypothetical protein
MNSFVVSQETKHIAQKNKALTNLKLHTWQFVSVVICCQIGPSPSGHFPRRLLSSIRFLPALGCRRQSIVVFCQVVTIHFFYPEVVLGCLASVVLLLDLVCK